MQGLLSLRAKAIPASQRGSGGNYFPRPPEAKKYPGFVFRHSVWSADHGPTGTARTGKPVHPGRAAGMHGRLPPSMWTAMLLPAMQQRGRWPDAWKVLQKSMPLSRDFGADLPCALQGALQAGAGPETPLRWACWSGPACRPLPRRFGSRFFRPGARPSPSWARAWPGSPFAWDLAKKGYAVRIHEPGRQAGAAPLRRLDPRLLPPEVLEEELERLTALNVSAAFNIRTRTPPDFH